MMTNRVLIILNWAIQEYSARRNYKKYNYEDDAEMTWEGWKNNNNGKNQLGISFSRYSWIMFGN
jgi:hypothetical protein